LYEQFSMPQYASPRPLMRSLPVSSAAAATMVGPPNFWMSSVVGPSGPKLPRKTTSALIFFVAISSSALTVSFSFSMTVDSAVMAMPFFAHAAASASRRFLDNSMGKQSRLTATRPRLICGMLVIPAGLLWLVGIGVAVKVMR